MDQFKSILASKAVWVGILGFVVSTAWGAKRFADVDPQAFAGAMVALVNGLIFIGTIVFRITATSQLTTSSDVAKAANEKVAQGIPPKAALVVAKAKVAAAENNRDIA